jgi:GNAT superfamily N-acetyltransferase
MTTLYEVRFSTLAPARMVFSQFLQKAGFDYKAKELESALNYRPHPQTYPLWASLLHQNHRIGIATLYTPMQSQNILAPIFIANFIIKPTHQRHGAGSYFLSQIELYGRSLGITQFALEPTQTSAAFWHAKGFSINPAYPKFLFKKINSQTF